MFTTTHTMRCDGGHRPDGTYCSNSISSSRKADLKGKAEGLGWKTAGSWFDRSMGIHTHICPQCQAAARGEEVSR